MSVTTWVANRTAMNEAMETWPTAAVAINVASATFLAGKPHTMARRSAAERTQIRAASSPTASINSVKSAAAPSSVPICLRIALY